MKASAIAVEYFFSEIVAGRLSGRGMSWTLHDGDPAWTLFNDGVRSFLNMGLRQVRLSGALGSKNRSDLR